MRALFFGTPDIAVPSLVALHEIAEVVGVVSQPDRPKGRGLHEEPTPVKAMALSLGLEVHQPTKVKTPEFAEWVASKNADVALVIAYGRILPEAVLRLPKRGFLNLHASLLPKYRGAAPITWAVANGDAETGVCLMQMDAGMDTGPVFSAHRMPIGPSMTAGSLSEALGRLAADVTRQDLRKVMSDELSSVPQDPSRATHARMLTKDDGLIPFQKTAIEVHDHIRAMSPWPSAFTRFLSSGKTLKVLSAEPSSGEPGHAPGEVIVAHRSRIEVACGEGAISLLIAQVEGKKPLGPAELTAGRTIAVGMRLGS